MPTTGCVLFAVKLDEPEHLWKAVCRAGRQADVVRIGRGHIAECRINALWLAYAANQSVESAVHPVDCLIEVAEGGGKGKSDGKDMFFRRSALNVCRHVLNILTPLGEDHGHFNNLSDLAKAAPDGDAYKHAKRLLLPLLPSLPPERQKDIRRAVTHFEEPWKTLADETESGILANISVLIEMFGSYPLRELLTESGTLRLDDPWLRRKVFLFTDSIQRYGQDARILQCTFKFLRHEAVARRDTRANRN